MTTAMRAELRRRAQMIAADAGSPETSSAGFFGIVLRVLTMTTSVGAALLVLVPFDMQIMLPALASSAALCVHAPESRHARLPSALGAQAAALLVGTLTSFIATPSAALLLALALSAFLMNAIRTIHPPAVGTAMIWSQLPDPTILGAAALVVAQLSIWLVIGGTSLLNKTAARRSSPRR